MEIERSFIVLRWMVQFRVHAFVDQDGKIGLKVDRGQSGRLVHQEDSCGSDVVLNLELALERLPGVRRLVGALFFQARYACE